MARFFGSAKPSKKSSKNTSSSSSSSVSQSTGFSGGFKPVGSGGSTSSSSSVSQTTGFGTSFQPVQRGVHDSSTVSQTTGFGTSFQPVSSTKQESKVIQAQAKQIQKEIKSLKAKETKLDRLKKQELANQEKQSRLSVFSTLSYKFPIGRIQTEEEISKVESSGLASLQTGEEVKVTRVTETKKQKLPEGAFPLFPTTLFGVRPTLTTSQREKLKKYGKPISKKLGVGTEKLITKGQKYDIAAKTAEKLLVKTGKKTPKEARELIKKAQKGEAQITGELVRGQAEFYTEYPEVAAASFGASAVAGATTKAVSKPLVKFAAKKAPKLTAKVAPKVAPALQYGTTALVTGDIVGDIGRAKTREEQRAVGRKLGFITSLGAGFGAGYKGASKLIDIKKFTPKGTIIKTDITRKATPTSATDIFQAKGETLIGGKPIKLKAKGKGLSLKFDEKTFVSQTKFKTTAFKEGKPLQKAETNLFGDIVSNKGVSTGLLRGKTKTTLLGKQPKTFSEFKAFKIKEQKIIEPLTIARTKKGTGLDISLKPSKKLDTSLTKGSVVKIEKMFPTIKAKGVAKTAGLTKEYFRVEDTSLLGKPIRTSKIKGMQLSPTIKQKLIKPMEFKAPSKTGVINQKLFSKLPKTSKTLIKPIKIQKTQKSTLLFSEPKTSSARTIQIMKEPKPITKTKFKAPKTTKGLVELELKSQIKGIAKSERTLFGGKTKTLISPALLFGTKSKTLQRTGIRQKLKQKQLIGDTSLFSQKTRQTTTPITTSLITPITSTRQKITTKTKTKTIPSLFEGFETVPVTTTPLIPPLIPLPTLSSGKGKAKKPKVKKKYRPSLVAVEFGIKTKKLPKLISGIGIRPLKK